MEAKRMDKAMSTVIVTLAIGALLGFGAGYYYMQTAQETAFAEGMAYQQSIIPASVPTYATATELDFSAIADFDHSATVDGDGNVAAETDKTQTLTITNDDEQKADNLWIMLYDPLTDEKGLDDDFDDAIDDIIVTIDFGGVNGIILLKDGEYTTGYELGDLPEGANFDVDITVTFLEHDGEDFPVGTEECNIYIYEPGANNVEEIEFAVLTT
jgi:hypothetical protein